MSRDVKPFQIHCIFWKVYVTRVIVGFRFGLTEFFCVLDYYVEWGYFEPTIRNHVLVPSLQVKLVWLLESSVSHHLTPYNNPEEWRIQSMLLLWKMCGVAGWGSALQSRRSRVWFRMSSSKCFILLILPAALWLWDRLSLRKMSTRDLLWV